MGFMGNLLREATQGGLGYMQGQQQREEEERQRAELAEEQERQLRLQMLQEEVTRFNLGQGQTEAGWAGEDRARAEADRAAAAAAAQTATAGRGEYLGTTDLDPTLQAVLQSNPKLFEEYTKSQLEPEEVEEPDLGYMARIAHLQTAGEQAGIPPTMHEAIARNESLFNQYFGPEKERGEGERHKLAVLAAREIADLASNPFYSMNEDRYQEAVTRILETYKFDTLEELGGVLAEDVQGGEDATALLAEIEALEASEEEKETLRRSVMAAGARGEGL